MAKELAKKLLEKLQKKQQSGHDKECDCFFCRNPKIPEQVKKIIDKINKEPQEEKQIITKNFVYTILSFTELTYIERLGIISAVEDSVKDRFKQMVFMQNIKEGQPMQMPEMDEGAERMYV